MTTRRAGALLSTIRGWASRRDACEASDQELLERFLRSREQTAFATLVGRHGPRVLGVCRRVLGRADDAFQATFLVLVRKASAIRPGGRVGNWLYGVACRTAREARRLAMRRRAKEAKAIPPKEAPEDGWTELRPLLDREIARLPDKYRAVLVLCDLEGKGRKEAAEQLHLPEGTVASRQARARAMLAKRLARHGLAVTGGPLSAVLPQRRPGARAVQPFVLPRRLAAVVSALQR